MQRLLPFAPLAESLRRLAKEEVLGAVIESVPHLVVDDHRWMLPAVWVARDAELTDGNGRSPLVLLDSHSELSPWDETSREHVLLKSSVNCDDVVSRCETPTNKPSHTVVHDGNWLSAAIKVDWLRAAITIGLSSPDHLTDPPGILECGRIDTRLFRRGAYWLEPQHHLYHEAIGWKVLQDRIEFDAPPHSIYLSVDLDAFADEDVDGRGMRPWRTSEFARRVLSPYKHGLAKGHSFREIYKCWLKSAAFVLISKETEMFSGFGRARRTDRAEQLLATFWRTFYESTPHLTCL